MYSNFIDKNTGVKYDQFGQHTGFYSLQGYREKIKKIKFYDVEKDRTFIFLTNNLILPLEEIAKLYKNR